GKCHIHTVLPINAHRPPRSGILDFYGQDEFGLTRKRSLSAGMRYDHYYTFGGTTNPRLGLIYHPFAQTTFKLLYGSAFRSPSAYEMSYSGLGLFQANLQLQPETIKSYEIVAEQGLGEHFHLTAIVFRNQVGRLITQGLNAEGLLVFENTRGARINGIETALDGRFPGGLQRRASYSYTDDKHAGTRQPLT